MTLLEAGKEVRIRAARWPSGLALIATLGACGGVPHSLDLMPAPAAVETVSTPAVTPAVATAAVSDGALGMLFATNRAPLDSAVASEDDRYYSGERGYLVRLGEADIGFGDSDVSWDEARRIALLKNRPGHFPLQVDGVREFGILPTSVSVFTPSEVAAGVDEVAGQTFAAAIEQRLARSAVKDVFVYVHGYKVNFENPLLVASEMWHFLGQDGAFVAFSWPSTPARLAYMKDIETARVSAWGLRRFLDYLASSTSARRIHVVGYSAGTRVVLTALYELALLHQGEEPASIAASTRLGNVILVGSDVDTGAFASYIIDGLLDVQERLTLYTSPADKALALSHKIFAHRRLGQVLPGTLDARMREFVAASPRLALVDVAEAADFDTGNGHAYFRNSPWVSADILFTLRHGLAPAARGLEQRDDSPVWRFPADYLERFERSLASVMTATPAATLE
ncbi:MAG: alpha/beta hydrolase [Gammaproteobacteria bacterium]